MTENKRNIGECYEKVAAVYLQKQGYEILQYNFRCRSGEIDIIAMQGGYLVFVEVKYRKNNRMGEPLESVSLQKQKKISRAALYYIQQKGLVEMPVRFDVVGILGEDIQLVQNAFSFVM